MSNSTHTVEVVPVAMEKHPNADALSIVRVFGYTAIVRTADWTDRQVGAYCPPDSMIPEGLVPGIVGRVKAKRLRGFWSEGLLIPAPEGASVGDDVAGQLGIGHYVPPMAGMPGGGKVGGAPAPSGVVPVYDLEAARRWGDACFVPGEQIVVTEKIHGANARYTFRDGAMHVGSRNQWKVNDPVSLDPWNMALVLHPEIEALCRASPGVVLYGEVYGQVQDLKYGVTSGARFVAFDIYGGTYIDHDDFETACGFHGVPMVPLLARTTWTNAQDIGALAEGKTTLGGDHVREGCVVRPVRERWHPRAGRVVLKFVGRGYLDRA